MLFSDDGARKCTRMRLSHSSRFGRNTYTRQMDIHTAKSDLIVAVDSLLWALILSGHADTIRFGRTVRILNALHQWTRRAIRKKSSEWWISNLGTQESQRFELHYQQQIRIAMDPYFLIEHERHRCSVNLQVHTRKRSYRLRSIKVTILPPRRG